MIVKTYCSIKIKMDGYRFTLVNNQSFEINFFSPATMIHFGSYPIRYTTIIFKIFAKLLILILTPIVFWRDFNSYIKKFRQIIF